MKIVFLTFLLAGTANAYDGVIKDKYGNITGYLDNDGDKIHVLDKYGNRGYYIEDDGTIKDKFGEEKGKIERYDDQLTYRYLTLYLK